MKNILFFGATGKLGRHWSKNLSNENKVYCNVHSNTKILKSKNLKKVKFDSNKNLEIYSFCKKKNISLIISCIGLANVEICEMNKKSSTEINYLIPSSLCKVAKKLDISFVHISTDMLFDGNWFSGHGRRP